MAIDGDYVEIVPTDGKVTRSFLRAVVTALRSNTDVWELTIERQSEKWEGQGRAKSLEASDAIRKEAEELGAPGENVAIIERLGSKVPPVKNAAAAIRLVFAPRRIALGNRPRAATEAPVIGDSAEPESPDPNLWDRNYERRPSRNRGTYTRTADTRRNESSRCRPDAPTGAECDCYRAAEIGKPGYFVNGRRRGEPGNQNPLTQTPWPLQRVSKRPKNREKRS